MHWVYNIALIIVCVTRQRGTAQGAGKPHELCGGSGSLIKLTTGFACECFNGFNGTFCDMNIDDCYEGACKFGSCFDRVNNFTCMCEAGWTGRHCGINIDDCGDPSPCLRGSCTDQVNNFTCDCDAGYIGYICDIYALCVPNPCVHGNCSDDNNGWFNCSCDSGYTGVNCTDEIDECLSNPCVHGNCTDIVDGYTCACEPGYKGSKCHIDIDECSSSPCQNGGTCLDAINGYTCSCKNGSNGIHCELDINECASNPCQNGMCFDRFNYYECLCYAGYTSNNCETEIDECSSQPCQHGNCTDKLNDYNCSCVDAYEGVNCEIYKLCKAAPCVHGLCENDGMGRFNCTCDAGYNGTLCEINIDECVSNPCVYGNCSDGVNGYTCICILGYEGPECQTEIDECASNPCMYGGTCTDILAGYNCTCANGFIGDNCEQALPCVADSCENGGTCSGLMSNFICTCRYGFIGSRCESCGGDLTAGVGTFTNPDYVVNSTDTYNCSWTITAAALGDRIELNLTITRANGSSNTFDYIEVNIFRTQQGYVAEGRYSDGGLQSIQSAEQAMRVDFLTYLSHADVLTFTAYYRSVVVTGTTECGGRVFGTKGVIRSPAYPASYQYDLSCSWLITGTVCSTSSQPMTLKYELLEFSPSDTLLISALMPYQSQILFGPALAGATNGILLSNESNVLVLFTSKGGSANKAMMVEFDTQDNCDFNLEDTRINKRDTSKFKRKYKTVGEYKYFISRLVIGLIFTLPLLIGYVAIMINDARLYGKHLLDGIEYTKRMKMKMKKPRSKKRNKKKEEEKNKEDWCSWSALASYIERSGVVVGRVVSGCGRGKPIPPLPTHDPGPKHKKRNIEIQKKVRKGWRI